jgi:hypothetical protein
MGCLTFIVFFLVATEKRKKGFLMSEKLISAKIAFSQKQVAAIRAKGWSMPNNHIGRITYLGVDQKNHQVHLLLSFEFVGVDGRYDVDRRFDPGRRVLEFMLEKGDTLIFLEDLPNVIPAPGRFLAILPLDRELEHPDRLIRAKARQIAMAFANNMIVEESVGYSIGNLEEYYERRDAYVE